MGCNSSKSQGKSQAVNPEVAKPGESAQPQSTTPADSPPPASKPSEEVDVTDAPSHQLSTTVPDDLKSAAPPAVDVPPGTVCFSQQSSMGVDLSVAGEARTRIPLGWSGFTWSDEEVGGSSSYRGVKFICSMNYLMPGLRAGTCSKRDSYAEMDYGMYCSPVGRLQVYEQGYLMFTDSGKYTESSVLEVRMNGNNEVEYVIDGRVVYVSKTRPTKPLHFATAWHEHPTVVTNIQYTK